jgi:hypothetical protein
MLHWTTTLKFLIKDMSQSPRDFLVGADPGHKLHPITSRLDSLVGSTLPSKASESSLAQVGRSW